jgi:hypothetical protein
VIWAVKTAFSFGRFWEVLLAGVLPKNGLFNFYKLLICII